MEKEGKMGKIKIGLGGGREATIKRQRVIE